MKRDIQKFKQTLYDVCVIGGGINGAGIAHTAALNGLKTALLEKKDFASGASSKSTKLIHGGLRYLENFELGLVRESLKERYVQLNSAPHLVRPLKFIIPVYKTDKRPLWMVRLGVWLYDFLSQKYVIEKHQHLSAEEVCRLLPGIEREKLIGGVTYRDAQMNDARLCLENILSADDKGADVANYVEVRSLIQENGKVVGVNARDLLHQQSFEVRAKKVVCAVGPWTNLFMKKESSQSPPQIRTTKGAHIIIKGRIAHDAILIPAQNDRRVFFVIPWMDNTLIGTTDTDYEGPADNVAVEQEDIDYLVGETQRVLPHVDLNEANIITTFAGLRPLVREHGSPEKISRKHAIKSSYSGLIYVMGGKYTTYRKIAEDVVSKLTKKPLHNTQELFPVYGSGTIKESSEAVGRKYDLDGDIVQSLMDFYGTRFSDVLSLIDKDPSLKDPICSCSSVIRAQIVYAIETEMAITEEDITDRRLMLGFTDCQSGKCREVIKEMLLKNGKS
jgi:glycerol-3-phosphate dehydrogenase